MFYAIFAYIESVTVVKINKNRTVKKDSQLSFNKIRNVVSVEFVKWILNPRLLIFIILIMFVYDYVIEELLTASHRMNEFLMILEPFIGIANSEMLIMVIPSVFIVLISDFPKTDGNTMFYIQRVGKLNWMFGQLFFGIIAAFSYISAILLFSMTSVAKNSFSANSWSNVVTQYVQRFPNESRTLVPLLISDRLYNNLTPIKTFFLTATLILLYLILLELLVLISFSIEKRTIGILSSYMVIAIGSSLCGLGTKSQWFFPSAHSLIWLHFDRILKFQNYNIKYSYIYYISIIILLFIISIFAIKHYDFSKITDMED